MHVDVEPGGTIVLKGSYHSTFDGSVVDAATTTWPSGAPGGSSVDTGGLIDLDQGGFHLVSRDPVKHEVVAVATDGPAPACQAAGLQAPCLPLRTAVQAHRRLITANEWASSLKGGIQVVVEQPPAYAPVTTFAQQAKPYLLAGVGVLLVAALGAVAWKTYRAWSRSARRQLVRLARSVRDKATRADPILAAPLAPALESALRAIDDKRVDPASAEGKRVVDVLRRVELRLDEKVANERAEDERRAADDLVQQVEVALEAAGEAARIGRAGQR